MPLYTDPLRVPHSSADGQLDCYGFLAIVVWFMLPWTFCASLCMTTQLHFPRNRVTGSCGNSVFHIWETAEVFPQWWQYFTFTPTVDEGFTFSLSSLTLVITCLSLLLPSMRYEVVPHCGLFSFYKGKCRALQIPGRHRTTEPHTHHFNNCITYLFVLLRIDWLICSTGNLFFISRLNLICRQLNKPGAAGITGVCPTPGFLGACRVIPQAFTYWNLLFYLCHFIIMTFHLFLMCMGALYLGELLFYFGLWQK